MNRTLVVALAFAVGASAVALTAALVVADDSAKPPVAPPAAQPAPDPKLEKVRTLMRLNGVEAAAKISMDKTLEQLRGTPGLPAGFVEKFREKANIRDIVELTVPIYAKHLDEATLDAAIVFFGSPAGRMLTEKQPLIMAESADAGAKWGAKLGAEVAKELAAKK